MPAPDIGHQETDEELAALIRRIHASYSIAIDELQKKIDDYMEQFEKQDAYYRALFDSGEMDYSDFIKWRRSAVMDTKQWKDMRDQLALDLTHENEIAASMINDTLPEVYAINHNYGTYEAEVGSGYDTTYTLYDRFTAARLMKDNEYVLPNVNVPKDIAWNKQLIQSSVLQGILQGEPMKDIAGRFERVVGMTESSAMRNARTAVTGAENAGRVDSYIRAEKMGIGMKQVWMATLDGRTRDSHAAMDGETIAVGKKFSNGCKFPGDPSGAPAEVYNCRCTLVAEVEGADPYNPASRPSEYLKEQGLTYEEWKEMHRLNMEQPLSLAEQIATGKIDRLSPDATFGFMKGEGERYNAWWHGDENDPKNEKPERIEQTIAIMQQRYPMEARIHDKYDCTLQKIILTDYNFVPIYLPNGENDRRYDDDSTILGQVFHIERNGIEISVIGFHRESISSNPNKFIEVIKNRSNAIKNGEIIKNLSGFSAEGISIHEWGHVFANQHMDNAMVHGSENAEAYWKWYQTLTKDEIRNGISDYASTNRGEFEAECLLELQMPNPRPLAIKWWSFMSKVIEEGY